MNAQPVLTLTNTGQTSARRAPRTRPQNLIMQQIAQVWTSLDADTQGNWQDFAQQMTSPTLVGLKTRRSAYGTFFAHNSTLLAVGAPITTDIPVTPPDDLSLPALGLTANFVGPLLTLTAAATYPNYVLVSGAKPLYASQNPYLEGQFKQIGALHTLAVTNNVTALYLSKFRLPTAGYRIALKLIGVSPDGFKSAPLIVSALAEGRSALTLE